MTSEGTGVVECRGEEAAWGEGRHKSPTTPSISGTAAEEEAEKEQRGERAEVTAAREQEEALRSVASGQHWGAAAAVGSGRLGVPGGRAAQERPGTTFLPLPSPGFAPR